jgi:NAD(P)-dependent dehydrogenase (short-subunit alcohol dehydrogenase family)
MPKDGSPEINDMPELLGSSIFDVSGKIGLVTGGGTGIGKMIAAAYVRNGAKIYIASRKLGDLEKQAQAISSLAPSGGKNKGPACIALQADVSTKAGCDALAAQIKEKESHLDILVNNAGVTWGAALDDFPEAKGWDKTFALNVKSQFYLTVA